MADEIEAGWWPVNISRAIASDSELARAFRAIGKFLLLDLTEEQDYYLEVLTDRVWEYEQVYHSLVPGYQPLPEDLYGKPLEDVIPALIRRGWNFRSCRYMKYKDYVAKTWNDSEAGVIRGEVLNLRNVITFQGRTPAEARLEFRRSVDNYLEFVRQHPNPETASS